MKIKVMLFTVAVAMAVMPGYAFDIAKNGRARATIVTGDKPSVVVSGMAEELAKYLNEMTGAEFTVTEKKKGGLGAIRLAIDKTGKMASESFTIKDDKRKKELVITGADDRGLVFGVYGFLERQGCRFWAPDQTTIPKKPTLAVPSGCFVTDAPAFTFREAGCESCRVSPPFCRQVGLNKTVSEKPVPAHLGADAFLDVNHSIAGKRRFINADKHFAAHPDWYGLRFVKGKAPADRHIVTEGEGTTPATRLKEPWHTRYDGGKGGDLIRSRIHVCTTHPDMTKTLIAEVREYLKGKPGLTSLSIAADDDGSFCQCERCDAFVKANGGQLSALYLNLANQVAHAIKDEFPKVTVYVMAYYVTENPPFIGQPLPKAFKEKLAPNLAVCLAIGMFRGPFAPVADDKALLRKLDDWLRLAPVTVWGYYANFTNFMYPYDDIFNMAADLKAYAARGVKQIFAQMTWGCLADFADLRPWLFGKLTWNPNQDGDALIKEWVDGTCGKGAPFINAYLKVRKEAKTAKLKTRGKDNGQEGKVLVEEYRLMEQALAATKDDPASFARVEKLSAGLIAQLASQYTRYDLGKAAKAAKVDLPARDALLDRLEGLFIKYNCEWVAENRYGWKGYIKILRDRK